MTQITPDFLGGQLRVALVAIASYGAGRGWFTPADATLFRELVTALGPIALPWLWSIYVNIGATRIPANSVAAEVAKTERFTDSPRVLKDAVDSAVDKLNARVS